MWTQNGVQSRQHLKLVTLYLSNNTKQKVLHTFRQSAIYNNKDKRFDDNSEKRRQVNHTQFVLFQADKATRR